MDLKVRGEHSHLLVNEYRLAFTDEIEWLDCVRLLEQAKSHVALRMTRIRQNLEAAANDFVPND